jgi:O-antigen/teichoic acid export membrane protein
MAPRSERTPDWIGDPLAAGEAGARFVRGGVLRITAYVGAIASSIVAMPFVTRHLHSSNYGRYVVVTSLMVIVGTLTEGGIAGLGVREFSHAPQAERRDFMRGLLGLRIVLSAAGGAGAIVFALLVGYPRVVVEGTAIAAIGLVLANLQVTLTVPLTAALALGWLAVLDFLTPAVTALALIALVVLDAPLLAFFAPAVLAFLVGLAVTSTLVRHQVSLRPVFNLARWRTLLGDSVVFAAATALALVYFQIVVVAMSIITTAHQTGIFSLAFRILSVVNGIPVVIAGSAFPILLRAARDDHARLHAALQRLIEGNLLLGGWLSLLVVSAAPFAVRVLGGPGYLASIEVLRILGTGVIATFLAAMFAYALLAVRMYRALVAISSGMVILAVVLCATLIPAHGARGAAIVTLSLEVVLATAYGLTLFTTNPELRPALSVSARTLVALALAFAVALVLPVSSVLAAVAGTAVLAIAVVALRVFPRELLELVGLRTHAGGAQ